MRQLFDDLSDRLRQLLPLPAGQDVGFMDSSMEAGTQWAPELLRNLATCQVFVALLSEPYLHRSEWCPMEWHLFSKRKVTRVRRDARNATAIIPVLWTPSVERPPPMVSDIQRFTPAIISSDYVPMYESEGVLGMSYLDPDAYLAVVWILARQVQIAWASLDVEPLENPNTNGLRRSFADGAR